MKKEGKISCGRKGETIFSYFMLYVVNYRKDVTKLVIINYIPMQSNYRLQTEQVALYFMHGKLLDYTTRFSHFLKQIHICYIKSQRVGDQECIGLDN